MQDRIGEGWNNQNINKIGKNHIFCKVCGLNYPPAEIRKGGICYICKGGAENRSAGYIKKAK